MPGVFQGKTPKKTAGCRRARSLMVKQLTCTEQLRVRFTAGPFRSPKLREPLVLEVLKNQMILDRLKSAVKRGTSRRE